MKGIGIIKRLAEPFLAVLDIFKGYGAIYRNYRLNDNKPFKYNLAIAVLVKNEAPYLKEWIEYHKLVGVKQFYIYDNYSTDATLDILRPYIETGEVIHTVFPDTNIYSNKVQVQAFNDAIARCKNTTKWLAVIDIDEFIAPVGTNNLVDILKTNDKKGVAAIEMPWVLYGYSGNYSRPKGLLIENYTKSCDKTKLSKLPAAWEWMREENFKSIVNPRMVIKKGVHGAIYIHKHGHKIIRMDKTILRTNHYWTRSYEELCEKLNRNSNSADNKNKYKVLPEYESDFLSHKDDYVMEKFVPILKEKMGIC